MSRPVPLGQNRVPLGHRLSRSDQARDQISSGSEARLRAAYSGMRGLFLTVALVGGVHGREAGAAEGPASGRGSHALPLRVGARTGAGEFGS